MANLGSLHTFITYIPDKTLYDQIRSKLQSSSNSPDLASNRSSKCSSSFNIKRNITPTPRIRTTKNNNLQEDNKSKPTVQYKISREEQIRADLLIKHNHELIRCMRLQTKKEGLVEVERSAASKSLEKIFNLYSESVPSKPVKKYFKHVVISRAKANRIRILDDTYNWASKRTIFK